jgi:hypothetical protein
MNIGEEKKGRKNNKLPEIVLLLTEVEAELSVEVVEGSEGCTLPISEKGICGKLLVILYLSTFNLLFWKTLNTVRYAGESDLIS